MTAQGSPWRCQRLIRRWRRSCGDHVGVPDALQARDKEWRAAAWWLERTYPERYGARRTIRSEAAGANAPITLAGLAAAMCVTDEEGDTSADLEPASY
jgi:hypothetical protein